MVLRSTSQPLQLSCLAWEWLLPNLGKSLLRHSRSFQLRPQSTRVIQEFQNSPSQWDLGLNCLWPDCNPNQLVLRVKRTDARCHGRSSGLHKGGLQRTRTFFWDTERYNFPLSPSPSESLHLWNKSQEVFASGHLKSTFEQKQKTLLEHMLQFSHINSNFK